MDIPFANKPSESDAIKGSTLNITKATTAGAGLLGLLTAFLGDELTSFTQGQQTAIVIGLVAAIAVVRAADLIARAMATARAATVETVAIPPTAASYNGTGPTGVPAAGSVVAQRGETLYLFRADGGALRWVGKDDLDFA